MGKFSHIDDKNKPKMVNVIAKKITKRKAVAQAKMFLGNEIISLLDNEEINTKKGPVFQTAIIAGIQAVKRTAEIIPIERIIGISAKIINFTSKQIFIPI